MEGMTLEKLQVIIEAYTKPYKDELEKVRRETTSVTDQVEKETTKMRNAFGKVAAAAGALVSIGAIAAFGKSCIELGSDLAEVQNVVDVTFGDMSQKVEEFSKNAITQYGLSELTAKRYMGTLGAMAKSFDITGEAGYQMAAAVTGLTGDVASFYNLSTDEAYMKLKSIFTGETESLKDIGVVMTQTALDQYALNNGFGKTTAKMTEQEKVMLRYQFVMSSLSDASEDFARTSHTWANQVRVLGLQFESLKATIGQGLINAFTPVIRVINEILARLQTLAAYFKAFTAALFGDAGGDSSISGAADSLASAAGSSGAIADNMNAAAGAAKKMKDYTLGIDELNILSPESEGSGSGGSGASGGAGVPDFGSMSGTLFGDVTVNPEIEAATDRIWQAVERLKETAQPTTDALNRLWNDGLAQLGNFSWTALRDFWDYFLVPLGVWTLGEGFPRFIDITNDFLNGIEWEEINEALREFWIALEPFAENVGEGLLWFYGNVLSPLAQYTINLAVPAFLDDISGSLEGLDFYIEKIKPGFEWLGEKIDWLFSLGGDSPIIKEWIADTALDNVYGSVGALGLLKDFTDAMQTWKGLEEWWNNEVLPYLDEKEWKNLWDVIPTGLEIALDGTTISWQGGILKWWLEDVIPWFAEGKWNELYKIVPTSLDDAQSSASELWKTGISLWWQNHVSPWFIIGKWNPLYDVIRTQLGQKWNETSEEWKTNLSSWWNEDVSPWFTIAKWLELYDSIRSSIGETWVQTSEKWKLDIDSWWKNDVSVWFTLEKWTGIMAKVPDAFKDIFKGAVNAAVSQLNKLIDWINDKLNFEFDGLEILGEEIIPSFSIQLFTIPHIPEFASGGIANSGQLFIANEAGPELIGRYGSRAGVMNNDQIVSAVSEGVATAVANVMAAYEGSDESNQQIELTVNLDGRTVSKSVHKAERRGGFKFRTV